MSGKYNQFCPVAKGAEIVATRWTPLVLREIMCGEQSFNDIHRGVPLMSRALLAERLRQLEEDGIIERRQRRGGTGHDYCLTGAGEALRPVIETIGRWGLAHGRDRIENADQDAGVLMWALRRRIDRSLLPPGRTVIRFELSGVARSATSARLYWLVLTRAEVDVCSKDPGFTVDITISGPIGCLTSVYLGYATWAKVTRKEVRVMGEPALTAKVESWLRLDQVVGRDLPVIPAA
jgi:DNA-binding HxlR family transcriptional regulator